MEATASALMTFPSEGSTLRASWAGWELAVYDMLEAAAPGANGLLSFGMAAGAFTALTGDAPLAPQVDPGPPAEGLNVGQTAAHKYLTELFDKEQSGIKSAKTMILASLNAEALGLVTEPIHGTRRRTIVAIMDILRTTYGTLTAADLTHQKTLLLAPFQPATPVRDYIRRHREVHSMCIAAGQPMTEADAVAALRLGVKHVPSLANAVQHFVTTVPTVAMQTFEALATLLGEAEDNGEAQATTGSAGYSAASTGPPEAFSLATMSQMIAEAVSKAMNNADSKKPPVTGKKHYCWTHGPGGHSSQDCRQPTDGHVRTASNANRQGGAAVHPRFNKL